MKTNTKRGGTKREVFTPSEQVYYHRRKKFLQNANAHVSGAKFCALFAPNEELSSNRDQHYSYEPNADLQYLTGIVEAQVVLLLRSSTQGPRSVLFMRDRDPLQEKWVGNRIGIKKAKKLFNVDEILPIESFNEVFLKSISDSRVLFFPAGINKKYDEFIWRNFSSFLTPRINFPHSIIDARVVTSEMRLTKDKVELSALKHAVDITAHALVESIPFLNKSRNELEFARKLESNFYALGGDGLAFKTIVASGKNATCLHHSPSHSPIYKRELVLIDCGARFDGYCGDVTRCFPVGGEFTTPQAEVYDAVYESVRAGLKLCKPGSSLDEIHNGVVKSLIKSLIELNILSGSVQENLTNETYKRFYMHRSGHWLGLDVHDVSPADVAGHHFSSYLRPLTPNQVFTLEPGLYFDQNDKEVPIQYRGIGIRLEEDILITNDGCDILSKAVPMERGDLIALFN